MRSIGIDLRPPAALRQWLFAVPTLVGVLAITVLLSAIFSLPRQQREASAQVAHTLKVIGAASTLEAHLERMTNEVRSYLLRGDPELLAKTESLVTQVGDDLAALRTLTADSEAQRNAVDRLQPLIAARIDRMRGTIAFKIAGDQEGLNDRFKTQEARALSEQVVAGLDAIRAEAQRMLAVREREADLATRRTIAAIVTCGAIAAASMLSVTTLLLGRRRERAHLAELRRTEALLRTIMQSVPGPIFAKDRLGRNLASNPAKLALIGKPWAEVEGRTDDEVLDHRFDGEAIIRSDHAVMVEGRTLVTEERVGAGANGPRIFLLTKTPMHDADGTVIGLVGMAVDITERKQAEERLRAFNLELETSVKARTADLAASEARQRAYFNHSPIGMVVMRVRDDGDFVLEDLNPAARAAFGFAPDSAPGLTQSQLWPELVARDKQRKMQACASRREIVEYTVAREIHGKQRQLDIVLAPLLDDADDARCVLICVHDVTEQRALERQLVEQAERQAEAAQREMALFNNSPDELFVVRVNDGPDGPEFVYEAFSPALETVTGLYPGDLVGRTPEQCLPPDVALPILANYRRCVRERTTVKFATTRVLQIGARDVEGYVSPVRHPGTGAIVRLVGSVRDVTERNRMETALRHGQKMEAIGRLAAGVAHDFNNILQAVIGGLDLVIEEVPAGTPAREFASIALGSAMRGSHLTHHLLAYARKQMLMPQAIEVAAFLADLELLLARTLGPHIAIHVHVERALSVLADPGELQTALLNLAINAAHAMAKSGTLRIEARETRPAGVRRVEIAVSDTGTGMDQATLAQAVEPFFSTKGVNGTGLGLSMVQGFVEQSGGTLHIASTPGRGTTVALRLPPGLPPAASDAPASAAAPADATLAAGRILLVDDSTDVLVTVGAFLEKAGFVVVRTDSGDQALGVLGNGARFDALVSDYAMPGLNGVDLISQARLIQPGLPALIITGYAGFGSAEAEGTSILHKPFQRREMIDALVQLIDVPLAAARRGEGRVDAGAARTAPDRAAAGG
jgi:PAS domain S-box-containing protein